MDRKVEMITAYRRTTLRVLEGLPIEALNAIPTGFNNNLIWNFGHVLVSQQTMCYLNAGLKPLIDEAYIAKYRRGSKPDKPVDEAEFEALKKISESVLLQLDKDLASDVFSKFNPAMTSYGLELMHIGDVMNMLLFHEGLHLGYCMALKRAVMASGGLYS